MTTCLLVAALLGLPASGLSDVPQAPPTELVLVVSASPIRPDRTSLSSASASDPTSFAEYLFSSTTPCSVGGSVRDLASPPNYGWRVSGRVLRRLGENLLVEIEWQRLWEQSQRLDNGLKGSMQVSLHVGDRLPLDDIYVPLVPGCDALGTHLEATVIERVVSPPRAKMSGTATIAARAGTGTGSGVVLRNGEGQSATTLTGFGPGIASLAARVDVELWLVHTMPSGGEEVQRMTVPASPSSRFRFPAISIASAEGDATVEISGGVAAVVDVSGEKQLRVLIERLVTDNLLVNGQGQSLGAYQMPKPGDVYSFEIPAVRSKGVEVKSDRVSLRLRVVLPRDEGQ